MVEIVDLNDDGSKDLLVTNHVGDGGGSVFGYENILDGEFKRHTLTTDFPVTESGSH